MINIEQIKIRFKDYIYACVYTQNNIIQLPGSFIVQLSFQLRIMHKWQSN